MNPLGHPVVLALTGANESDIAHAESLLVERGPEAVIADKGYDSDAFVAQVRRTGAEAVIPPRRNRTEPRAVDWGRYRERAVVEWFWSKVKQYRWWPHGTTRRRRTSSPSFTWRPSWSSCGSPTVVNHLPRVHTA